LGLIFEVVTSYPATGYRRADSGAFSSTGSNGICWSTAVIGTNGYYLDFYSTNVRPTYNSSRAYGFPVRCVQNLLVLFKLYSYSHWVEVDLIFNEVVTFYPAAGYRVSTSGAFSSTGSNGICWSTAVIGTNGYFLLFASVDVHPRRNDGRAYGFPVRCVQHLLTCLVL
jgi:hypothetical protein